MTSSLLFFSLVRIGIMISAVRSTPYTIYPGVAAEDIQPDSVILKVICSELVPGALSGTVSAGITSSNVSLKDKDGKPINSTITTANHIVATWEGHSNLKYPPLIRKGEPVEVHKVADQDKFYWRAKGRGQTYRTTDRVHIEVGATDPTKPGVQKDDANTYTAYIDSDQKIVGFKTSKANGEAVAMTVHADLAQGHLIISDDSASPGNRIFLDTGAVSGTPMFQVNLSSGTTLQLNGKDVLFQVPGKMMLSAKDRIVFDSPVTVFNLNKAGAFIINASSFALNCAKNAVISCGSIFGINASTTNLSSVLSAGLINASVVNTGNSVSPTQPVEVATPTGVNSGVSGQ